MKLSENILKTVATNSQQLEYQLTQPDVQSAAVSISFRATMITAEVLMNVLSQSSDMLHNKQHKQRSGKMSIKALTAKADTLDKVDISKIDIKAMQKHLKKHGVDFALVKVPKEESKQKDSIEKDGIEEGTKKEGKKEIDTYNLFFKAKDTIVIKEGIEKTLKEIKAEMKTETKKESRFSERLKRAKEKMLPKKAKKLTAEKSL